MNTRDFIRTAVLKTNPFWPFSRLNKIPYQVAIKSFAKQCKPSHGVTSVYLRHPLTEGSWVPGLSDIDLAVIIDAGLSLEEEFSFLEAFWKQFGELKRYFPMLGEIEILTEDHTASWIKFGLEGYFSRKWVLLHGRETVNREFLVNKRKLAIESLNNAMRFYLGYFQDKLNQRHTPPYLVSQDLKRIASKILRCLNCPDADQRGKPIPRKPPEDKADMLRCILQEFEQGIRLITSYDNEAGSGNNNPEWLVNMVPHDTALPQYQAFDLGKLAACHEAIQSVILDSEKTLFIVLRDGTHAAAIKSCIDRIWQRPAGAEMMPVILTKSLLNYIFRYYKPFQYIEFVSRSAVLYGDDLLTEMRPPVKFAFIHNLMEQTPTSLTFPRSKTLILPAASDGPASRHVQWTMEKSLFLKMYLEKGIVEPRYRDRLAQCQRYYPHYHQAIEQLDRSKGHTANGFMNRKWFRFLREIADDIHLSISTSNIVDDLFAEKSAQ